MYACSASGQDQQNKSIPDRCLSNLLLKASKERETWRFLQAVILELNYLYSLWFCLSSNINLPCCNYPSLPTKPPVDRDSSFLKHPLTYSQALIWSALRFLFYINTVHTSFFNPLNISPPLTGFSSIAPSWVECTGLSPAELKYHFKHLMCWGSRLHIAGWTFLFCKGLFI